jgi:hypothetical protein
LTYQRIDPATPNQLTGLGEQGECETHDAETEAGPNHEDVLGAQRAYKSIVEIAEAEV